MEDSDFEGPNTTPFIAAEWIGAGKKVPAPNDMPDGLANYLGAIKAVPEDVKEKHYPQNHITVEDFRQIKLPKLSYTLPRIKVEACFNKAVPNEAMETLSNLNRPLPSRQLVQNMLQHLPQAVLDGNQSVLDPAFLGSLYPLWTVRYWLDIWDIADSQDSWRKGLKWLDATIKSEGENDVFLEAQRLTRILRWNEESDIPGANRLSVSFFAKFLSNSAQMSTSHINMMFSHLSDRMEADEDLDALVGIETLRFWDEIKKAPSAKYYDTMQTKSFIRRLETRLANEEIDYLVFPVRMDDEEHWLTFKLDFTKKEIMYG